MERSPVSNVARSDNTETSTGTKPKRKHSKVVLTRILQKLAFGDIQDPNTCWEWTGGTGSGYGVIKVAGKMELAHRAILTCLHGPIGNDGRDANGDKLFVCHRCDNPLCVRPTHLFLGTSSDNSVDALKKGRLPQTDWQGSEKPTAKLTEEKVRIIRRMHARGYTHEAIADLFSVARTTVLAVIHRRSWAHVADEN